MDKDPTSTTSPTGLLGPLTTTFTPPTACSTPVFRFPPGVLQASFQSASQAQTCSSSPGFQLLIDATTCWPNHVSLPQSSISLHGAGYYSPGLICPVGYSTACTATGTGGSNFEYQFPLSVGDETAVGCCPRYGFSSVDQAHELH